AAFDILVLLDLGLQQNTETGKRPLARQRCIVDAAVAADPDLRPLANQREFPDSMHTSATTEYQAIVVCEVLRMTWYTESSQITRCGADNRIIHRMVP